MNPAIRLLRAVRARIRARFDRSQPIQLEEAPPEPVQLKPTAVDLARQAWVVRGHGLLADVLMGQRTLVAECAPEPKISVIVILHNKASLSVMALASLIEYVDVPYELIVVDNASTDETLQLLEMIEGLQVQRFDQNLGFGPACNLAVKRARGEYLLFFNNDALLGRGAVHAALKVFDELAHVGAVGGKIILSDGTLQELGAFVWGDGMTSGYGRGDNPNLDLFARRLACDYCSGAFLVTPRALFESLGGFDARYAPAYYEDVDYCAALWARGYAVVAEPTALVRHYESATSVDAAVTLSAINREKFCEKWADWLADRPGYLHETMQDLIAPVQERWMELEHSHDHH